MRLSTLLILAGTAILAGCAHPPEITSVPASPFNQCEPPGMPFYLPKPLLVVSKNVRHIDEAKVGLTEPAPIPNAFDDQASYADIKANVTSPGKAGSASLAAGNVGGISRATGENFDETAPRLPEGWRGDMIPQGRVKESHDLTPDSFYTYQVIFVPDLSQKYGLRIKGKPGEVRAAMNMVNGWMYTGMGPYYLKDSSTAQNIMAVGVASMFAGRGAADVLDSVTGLASAAGAGRPKTERAAIDSDDFIERVARVARVIQSQTLTPREMLNYAEVTIYEPTLNPLGGTDWRLIAHHNFSRQYFSPDMDVATSELLRDLLDQQVPVPGRAGGAIKTEPPAKTPAAATPVESSPGGPPTIELPAPSSDSSAFPPAAMPLMQPGDLPDRASASRLPPVGLAPIPIR